MSVACSGAEKHYITLATDFVFFLQTQFIQSGKIIPCVDNQGKNLMNEGKKRIQHPG